MGFYTFELDAAARKLCVISTPFGLYQYLRLPMGLTNSPDVFQSVMHPLFQDMPEVECFIDDIGIFTTGSFEHHLNIVSQVLLRLEESGFTVNPIKCAWAVTSTDYLGFLLTPQGLKPMPSKIEAISRVARPTSTKHVRSFVGLINYYKDMWPRRAHILAPLTNLCSSKTKFHWTDVHESSFQQAKRLVAEDVLLRFPDHSKPFDIFTDTSKYQIGETIKQNNLPIAYFSKKLTPTQQRCSTIEQEMLAIVEVLKEYRNFLLGAQITLHTDHKNLLANTTVNDRVLRWKTSPNLLYVKGQKNTEADALSRLPMMESGMECMLNHPPLDPYNPLLNKYPLDLELITQYQQKDTALLQAVKEDKHFFFQNRLYFKILTHQEEPR